MNIPPLYMILGVIAVILVIALIKLLPSKETPEFIEIEKDNGNPLPPPPKLITIYLIPKSPIDGRALLEFFMNHKLQFSEKQKIFISLNQNHEQFYVATLSSPGTFNESTIVNEEYPGLSFFMQPSKSSSALDAFDALCLVLFDAKEIFDAHLQHENKSEISLDQLREIREQISQHSQL